MTMKKIILIALLLPLLFASCSNKESCNDRGVKKTALRLFKNEVTAELAYGRYYKKVINTPESALVRTLSLMAGERLDISRIEADAIHAFRKMAKGETVKEVKRYQPYMHYADSIMHLGETKLEMIMTTGKTPELKKCTCKARLVFDPKMGLRDINVSYDVQKAADGEIYITIYMERIEK